MPRVHRLPSRNPRTAGAFAGAAALLSAACAGRTGRLPPSDAVARFAGCYALSVDRWTRGALTFGGRPAPPPPHVRLVAEPDSAGGRVHYPVRPDLAGPSARSATPASWTVDGRNAVRIDWFTGPAGYRVLLTPAGPDTLRGIVTAVGVGLTGAIPARAPATAVREPCPPELR